MERNILTGRRFYGTSFKTSHPKPNGLVAVAFHTVDRHQCQSPQRQTSIPLKGKQFSEILFSEWLEFTDLFFGLGEGMIQF